MPHVSAEDFRCTLEQNNTRLAFFIGAGVSYDSPASLPLAGEWKAALIEGLLGCSTIDTRMGSCREPLIEFARSIPLESLFQPIQKVTSDAVFSAGFSTVAKARPNRSHLAIAKLAKAERVSSLITTNFDTCLELALDRYGVPYRVAATPADFLSLAGPPNPAKGGHPLWLPFSPTLGRYDQEIDDRPAAKSPRSHPTDRPGLLVAKIHGSADQPKSIVATMERIMSGLPWGTCRTIAPILNSETVVFVGWSDADIDLTPLLKVPNPTPTYWLHHAPTGAVSGGVLDLLMVRGKATQVVECDVPRWLAALAGLPEVKMRRGTDSDRKRWRVLVQEWCASLLPVECDLILSSLLMRAGYLHEAVHLAKCILAKKGVSFRARAFGALICSRVLLAQEKRDRAVAVLHQVAGQRPLNRNTVSIRLAEAKCYCHTTNQADAERLIAKIARWSKDNGDHGSAAYCTLHRAEKKLASMGTWEMALASLGVFVGSELVQATERGMVFAGDFEGLIAFLLLLARVRVALNAFDKAREHVLRAHELVTIYGDTILLVNVTNHVGVVEAQAGSLATAREWFARAAKLADEYGLPLEAGFARMNAGLTWEAEDKHLSESLLQEASELIEPLGLVTYTRMIRHNRPKGKPLSKQPEPRAARAIRRLISQYRGIPSTFRLRATPSAGLSDSDVTSMIKRLDLYERDYNPGGMGIPHSYASVHFEDVTVILDSVTGLTWATHHSGLLSFDQSNVYLSDLNNRTFGSFNDWRLPTLEEALSLVEVDGRRDGALGPPTSVWTSDKRLSGEIWVVGYVTGECGRVTNDSFSRMSVLPVRTCFPETN
jgi:tetratricopeptide (TPR) repeat protein